MSTESRATSSIRGAGRSSRKATRPKPARRPRRNSSSPRSSDLRPQIYREHATRPTGRIALIDAHKKVIAVGQGAIELGTPKGISVEQVEYGMGYLRTRSEMRMRTRRGSTPVRRRGRQARGWSPAVPMERLVKGVGARARSSPRPIPKRSRRRPSPPEEKCSRKWARGTSATRICSAPTSAVYRAPPPTSLERR